MPELLRRVDERLQTAELPTGGHAEVLTACHILLGLRYDKFTIQNLFRELRTMRESSTYQAILDEGRAEGELNSLRKTILQFAKNRLGVPSNELSDRLSRITNEERLREMIPRALTANTWNEILDNP